MQISFPDLLDLLERGLAAEGMSQRNAASIARVIAAAEQDGAHGHGVFRLRGYVETLRSGWVDGRAEPVVDAGVPGLVKVDARNGFAQPAQEAGREALIAKTRTNGIAAMLVRDSHHFAALWPDVEPLAEAGLVALAFVNGRSRVAPWGGDRKLFGTNPMAFACPRRDGPPIVWDQASSTTANAALLMAARDGQPVEEGTGIDARGRPTTDPNAILAGGAQLPFGQHKGSMIALMVEILAAALTGGRFGMEDTSAAFPGAQTSRAGETIIAIEPTAAAGDGFLARIETLCAALEKNGAARIPGSRRHAERRRNASAMLEISDDAYRFALGLLP